MADATDLGPLDWRIGIVDRNGRPTPEFQRRWESIRSNDSLIGSTTSTTTSSGNSSSTPSLIGSFVIEYFGF